MDADLGVQTSSRECFSGKVLAEDVGGDYDTHVRRKLCMGSGSYALLLIFVCGIDCLLGFEETRCFVFCVFFFFFGA
jgi:hypothetical protein